MDLKKENKKLKEQLKELKSLSKSKEQILLKHIKELNYLRKLLDSERHSLEEKIEKKVKDLKKSKELYKELFKKSADAIMTLKPPKWNFTSCNPATINLFNTKTEKKFTETAPWKLSPKYQPDNQLSSIKAKRMIKIAMKKGSNFFEWKHKKLNGEEFNATVLLTRVNLHKESFLQATVRNINKEKEILHQLNIYKEGFESSPNSMVLVKYENKKAKIIHTNKAFTQFYGYSEKEAYDKNPKILKSGKLDKRYYQKMWKSILDPKIGSWRDNIVNKKKNGTFINVNITIITIFDKNKKPVYFVAHHNDITKMVKKTKELERFYNLTIDRELKMIEMKKEIKILKK